MSILTIIQDVNQDCKLSNKINDTIFTEGNQESNKDSNNRVTEWYPTIDKCIHSMCDKMISIIPKDDKEFYLDQLIMKICSEIDENENSYEKCNYNKRIMNKNKIQQGLQLDNHLSSLLYLSDYYRIHFVLVKDDVYYQTCILPHPKMYLHFKDDHYMISKTTMKDVIKEVSIFSKDMNYFKIINNLNISNLNIYKTDLKAISNYNLSQLVQLAEENKINHKCNGKNLKKRELYDKIVLKKIISDM
jgi:hypothetical protein